MTAHSRRDAYALRAGEEFIAASRAPCPQARARHRLTALIYADLLRAGDKPGTAALNEA
jgi:hypothetical protein